MPSPNDPTPRGALLDRAPGRPSMVEPLNRLLRVIHAMKSALSAASTTTEARERAAHVLLFPLVEHGPLRQGALAELVHADPSTVSRHVSLLVERGLVRRVADAHDGRASRLVATGAGEATLAAMRRDRQALLEQVTSSWSPDDIDLFTTLLDRFAKDLSDHLPSVTTAPGGHVPDAEKDR